MSILIGNCPRCNSKKITFDLLSSINLGTQNDQWVHYYEAFCFCRHCKRTTIFILRDITLDSFESITNNGGLHAFKNQSVNNLVEIVSFIGIKDNSIIEPPEYVPDKISSIFKEGTACFSIGCYNASGTMLRLVVDLITKYLLPENNENGLSDHIRRTLGLRLKWLFQNNLLPEMLKELSICIKEDGNDGAHEGSLNKEDVEDLLDFTKILLERIYTEPERIRLANERRIERRNQK